MDRGSAIAIHSADGFGSGIRACFEDICSDPAVVDASTIYVVLPDSEEQEGTLRLEGRDGKTLAELDLTVHLVDDPCQQRVHAEATYTPGRGLVEVSPSSD